MHGLYDNSIGPITQNHHKSLMSFRCPHLVASCLSCHFIRQLSTILHLSRGRRRARHDAGQPDRLGVAEHVFGIIFRLDLTQSRGVVTPVNLLTAACQRNRKFSTATDEIYTKVSDLYCTRLTSVQDPDQHNLGIPSFSDLGHHS
jgi:hypothetical protein